MSLLLYAEMASLLRFILAGGKTISDRTMGRIETLVRSVENDIPEEIDIFKHSLMVRKPTKTQATKSVEALTKSYSKSQLHAYYNDILNIVAYFSAKSPKYYTHEFPWVAMAAHRDIVHHNLHYIHIDSGVMTGCDGHRYHRALTDLDDGYYLAKNGERVGGLDMCEYAPIDQVTPKNARRVDSIEMISHRYNEKMKRDIGTWEIPGGDRIGIVIDYMKQARYDDEGVELYYACPETAFMIKHANGSSAVIMPVKL